MKYNKGKTYAEDTQSPRSESVAVSHGRLDGIYEEIISMLATMGNHPEKWCP